MVRIHQTRVPMWVQQANATLDQDDPVSGTKYVVLDTVKMVRILGCHARVAWTVQPTPLEIHITIDGKSLRAYQDNPVTATRYYLGQGVYDEGYSISDLDYSSRRAFLDEGKSIKIEAETTGGTVSNISALVKYALRR